MSGNETYNGLEIAIIGLSAQFPGSDDYGAYWKNLTNGYESIKPIPESESEASAISGDRGYVGFESILKDKGYFDNSFFGYRPDEAALMDPQIRIFHEHCWKAIEDSGYSAMVDAMKIGLFAAASQNDNWKLYAFTKADSDSIDPFYLNFLSSEKFISSLVSYKLNLKGPSVYIDTACSSSLVAVHMACRSLLTRECSYALAGGVRISTVQSRGYYYKEGMIFSSDGHCRAFDASSTGTIAGEGVGIVALKRLNEAIEDRDNIYAVIKSGSVNNDGNNKAGYTAPGIEGQSECIKSALRLSGVDSKSISYVEAHGTGTRLGDPIEVEALNIAYNRTGNGNSCALGSVKTNIGHLDAAAGVAGLIKAVLCLRNKKLVPSLHYGTANPEIDFEGGPFYVNTEYRDWDRQNGAPLRAGVSSFGIGGTNAHLVLEEAPVFEKEAASRKYKLLLMSAKTRSSIEKYGKGLLSHLEACAENDLEDIAYTSQIGRKHFQYRRSILFENKDDLMGSPAWTCKSNLKEVSSLPDVVFAFSGQGAAYTSMGKSLYEGEPAFKELLDRAFEILSHLTGRSFKEVLYDSPEQGARLKQSEYDEAVSFLFEYALANLLISWGIVPSVMIGHGIGEYVAACVSGVFNLEDALTLISVRAGLLDPAAGDLQEIIKRVSFGVKKWDFISNATGQLISEVESKSIEYWLSRRTDTTKFMEGIHTLLQTIRYPLFLEMGVGNSLSGLASQHDIEKLKDSTLNMVRHSSDGTDDLEHLMTQFGEIWGRGININWRQYHKDQRRRRVSLPTYSFDPIEYPSVVKPNITGGLSDDKKDQYSSSLPDWIYYPVWKGSMPLTPIREKKKRVFLLFSCADITSDNIKSRLLADGSKFIEVIASASYQKKSSVSYLMDPSDPKQFERLAFDCSLDHFPVTNLVYLWSAGVISDSIELMAGSTDINILFFSLIYIARAFLTTLDRPDTITVVTNRLHRVNGNEMSFAQSLSCGILNVISQEYNLFCSNIDFDPEEDGLQSYDRLVTEIKYNDRDRTVVLRKGNRWLPDFQKHSAAMENGETGIRSGGLYLIVGGLGKVGFILAKYLLEVFQAKVILVGKTDFQVERLSGVEDERASRLRQLQQISSGVSYVAADIAIPGILEKLVGEIESNDGLINGVIHAATANMDLFEFVEDITKPNALSMLLPKVKGVENLYHVFRNRKVDFGWIISSSSSVLGGLSFGAYAAANSFMNHFICCKSDELCNWRCINLSELLFTPDQVAEEVADNRTGLKPDELTSLLKWSASISFPVNIFESIPELSGRFSKVRTTGTMMSEAGEAQLLPARSDRRISGNMYSPPGTETERALVIMMEEFFGVQPVGIEDDFFDLGGDSLEAMSIIRKMNRQFGVNLTVKDFFSNPDIKRIARQVDEILSVMTPRQRSSKKYI